MDVVLDLDLSDGVQAERLELFEVPATSYWLMMIRTSMPAFCRSMTAWTRSMNACEVALTALGSSMYWYCRYKLCWRWRSGP